MPQVTPQLFHGCTFPLPRLLNSRGLQRYPLAYDGLSFQPPHSHFITSRDVLMNDRRFQVWSLNGGPPAFYPGLFASLHSADTLLDTHMRRVDGSLGRFDWSLSPQHFDDTRPWLPFVEREPTNPVGDLESYNPELTPVPLVWTPNIPGINMGELSRTYLERLIARNRYLEQRMTQSLKKTFARGSVERVNRPQFPRQTDLDALGEEMDYARMVDRLTAVQRGVKEKAAWVQMAQNASLRNRREGGRCSSSSTSIARKADSRYLGVWINGMTEADVLWLLDAGVACYVIHRYQPGIDFPRNSKEATRVVDHRDTKTKPYPNFIEGTELSKRFSKKNNVYVFVAVISETELFNDKFDDEAYGVCPKITKEDRGRSASWAVGPLSNTSSPLSDTWTAVTAYQGSASAESFSVAPPPLTETSTPLSLALPPPPPIPVHDLYPGFGPSPPKPLPSSSLSLNHIELPNTEPHPHSTTHSPSHIQPSFHPLTDPAPPFSHSHPHSHSHPNLSSDLQFPDLQLPPLPLPPVPPPPPGTKLSPRSEHSLAPFLRRSVERLEERDALGLRMDVDVDVGVTPGSGEQDVVLLFPEEIEAEVKDGGGGGVAELSREAEQQNLDVRMGICEDEREVCESEVLPSIERRMDEDHPAAVAVPASPRTGSELNPDSDPAPTSAPAPLFTPSPTPKATTTHTTTHLTHQNPTTLQQTKTKTKTKKLLTITTQRPKYHLLSLESVCDTPDALIDDLRAQNSAFCERVLKVVKRASATEDEEDEDGEGWSIMCRFWMVVSRESGSGGGSGGGCGSDCVDGEGYGDGEAITPSMKLGDVINRWWVDEDEPVIGGDCPPWVKPGWEGTAGEVEDVQIEKEVEEEIEVEVEVHDSEDEERQRADQQDLSMDVDSTQLPRFLPIQGQGEREGEHKPLPVSANAHADLTPTLDTLSIISPTALSSTSTCVEEYAGHKPRRKAIPTGPRPKGGAIRIKRPPRSPPPPGPGPPTGPAAGSRWQSQPSERTQSQENQQIQQQQDKLQPPRSPQHHRSQQTQHQHEPHPHPHPHPHPPRSPRYHRQHHEPPRSPQHHRSDQQHQNRATTFGGSNDKRDHPPHPHRYRPYPSGNESTHSHFHGQVRSGNPSLSGTELRDHNSSLSPTGSRHRLENASSHSSDDGAHGSSYGPSSGSGSAAGHGHGSSHGTGSGHNDHKSLGGGGSYRPRGAGALPPQAALKPGGRARDEGSRHSSRRARAAHFKGRRRGG